MNACNLATHLKKIGFHNFFKFKVLCLEQSKLEFI